MTITKYKTVRWHASKIHPVEITRETAKCVYKCVYKNEVQIGDRREAKECESHKYHDTWEDSKKHLLEESEQKLVLARRHLQNMQGELGNVKGLKKPVEAS